ncbi:class E sortase [Rubrobacter tropicus]|nr:class E sortase [Rubrobacter tropicus]
MSNARGLVSGFVGLAMLVAGVALIGYFFLGLAAGDTATNSDDPSGFNVPRLETGGETSGSAAADGGTGPEDKTLKLTVPGMARIEDDEIPSTDGGDEASLKKYAAIHLEGTGFPWQEDANVYIAGHRLGYPNTESWLTFWDLDKLEDGDRIFLTDADGTEYTYEVFRESVVPPTDLSVTRPVPGKSVVTLQTCTLPDYSRRLIVQAELVEKTAVGAKGARQAAGELGQA